MRIKAMLQNSEGLHQVSLQTNDEVQKIDISPKKTGYGSSANGGELLFLALATCYCNDIYREAAIRGIQVDHIEVEVVGDFGAAGEPAKNVSYTARVKAQADEEEIRALLVHTDNVAEIQNTLRAGTAVTLSNIEIIRA